MKFPAIKTQDEILREMQKRIENPESQPDSPWSKIAALLLTCMKTDSLDRLIWRIQNFRKDAEEQLEIKKELARLKVYDLVKQSPASNKKKNRRGTLKIGLIDLMETPCRNHENRDLDT